MTTLTAPKNHVKRCRCARKAELMRIPRSSGDRLLETLALKTVRIRKYRCLGCLRELRSLK